MLGGTFSLSALSPPIEMMDANRRCTELKSFVTTGGSGSSAGATELGNVVSSGSGSSRDGLAVCVAIAKLYAITPPEPALGRSRASQISLFTSRLIVVYVILSSLGRTIDRTRRYFPSFHVATLSLFRVERTLIACPWNRLRYQQDAA